MTERILVAQRFCGPPGIANGGYIAGLLARGLSGAVEVTLREAVPLATPLDVSEAADGARLLVLGDRELARATRAKLELELPPQPPIGRFPLPEPV